MENFNFGMNLFMMRNYRNMCQQGMADELTISQTSYSRIEASKDLPEISMINKMAEILEFRPKDLVSADWYADAVYGRSEKTKRSVVILNLRGQIAYIILLLAAWLDGSFGFFRGLEVTSLDLKLFCAAVLGMGVFLFHYFSVKRIEI